MVAHFRLDFLVKVLFEQPDQVQVKGGVFMLKSMIAKLILEVAVLCHFPNVQSPCLSMS